MSDSDYETKKLICELCRQFFNAGWVTGTGGSISIRSGEKIFMTPSGVQKERIQPDEIFTVDINGGITETPVQKTGCREPKLSDCAPLFLHAYQQRNAGAVLHSHAASCNIITSLFEGQSEFTISHQEMIKGIDGYGYFDTLRIPIIENTAWEHELADSLGEAIARNPKSCAVLVRRHGMYVWGNSWEQAKRHGECLHYLFDIAIRMKQLGMDFNSAPKISVLTQKLVKPFKYVLLDIEGTTTPITFVKDTLFPYSATNMDSFLQSTWSTSSTTALVMQLKSLAAEYGDASVQAVTLAAADLSQEATARPAATAFALLCIQQDRKVGPLKLLQGMIWEQAYKAGDIKGTVYDDLIPRLESWEREGVRVAIYSSGSRYAQQLLFGHSTHGDLRHYFSAYFDTAVGPKQSASSYKDILLTLGIDQPSEVVFVTDILGEALAASEAGIQAVISLRSGNAPITVDHSFPTIDSFADL